MSSNEVQHIDTFSKIIQQHCQALEWPAEQQGELRFSLMFNMGEGRSQQVLMLLHTSANNQAVVEISSAVMSLQGLPEQQLGKNMAMRLLRENANRPFANWAVDENGNDAHLIATSRWLLDELDKEELALAVRVVAMMADSMEASLGVDNF